MSSEVTELGCRGCSRCKGERGSDGSDGVLNEGWQVEDVPVRGEDRCAKLWEVVIRDFETGEEVMSSLL